MNLRKWFLILLVAWLVMLGVSCHPAGIRMGMGDGDGVRLSYRIVGSGKPLVVIHDGPGWEKALMYGGFDGLRSSMTVIYYDQRGCGRSAPVSPATRLRIDDNVRDLEGLRQYLHVENLCLAAHGWGSVIALRYAQEYPEHVASIVLITPISPFSPEPQLEDVVDKLPAEGKQAVITAVSDPRNSMLDRREKIMRAIMPALFYDKAATEELDLRELRYSPNVNIRLSNELRMLNIFPTLREINIPTLVIIGRHDISIPVRDQMAYADGIATASAVVFNNSGHFPFLEEPEFFITVTKEFLLNNRIPALVDAKVAP
jgi:proline iminopeptidase